VRRRDCLTIGIISFCLFPTLAALSSKLGFGVNSSLTDLTASIGGIFAYIVSGALQFLPFGLISGWMLWWVGVRNTKTQELAEAPVFD
jgi:hypothetical protein